MKSKILPILIFGLLIVQPQTKTERGHVKNRDCALMVAGSFFAGILAIMFIVYCTSGGKKNKKITEEKKENTDTNMGFTCHEERVYFQSENHLYEIPSLNDFKENNEFKSIGSIKQNYPKVILKDHEENSGNL